MSLPSPQGNRGLPRNPKQPNSGGLPQSPPRRATPSNGLPLAPQNVGKPPVGNQLPSPAPNNEQRGLPARKTQPQLPPATPPQPQQQTPARRNPAPRPSLPPAQLTTPPVSQPVRQAPPVRRSAPATQSATAPVPARTTPQPQPQPQPQAREENPTPEKTLAAQITHKKEVDALAKKKRKEAEVPKEVKRAAWTESQKKKGVRILVLTVIVLSLVGNFKTLFFADRVPDPLEMALDVTYAMNKTTFPADKAEGFVQQFTSTLLNFDGNDEARESKLSEFTGLESGNASFLGLNFPAEYQQQVTDGPYINGVRYVSETVAVFTVGAEINNSTWEYYAVSVYFDPETKGFSIPKAPTVVPKPITATSPLESETLEIDEEATPSARTTVDAYFSAWVAGTQTELDVTLAADATINARNSGLPAAGIKLESVDSLSVLTQTGDFEGTSSYLAIAGLTLTKPVEGLEFGVQYKAEYELILDYSGEGNKWLIKDIRPREFVPIETEE